MLSTMPVNLHQHVACPIVCPIVPTRSNLFLDTSRKDYDYGPRISFKSSSRPRQVENATRRGGKLAE